MAERSRSDLDSSRRPAWRAFLSAPLVSDVASGRENNFNLIRFVAASMVIVFHEYCVAPTLGAREPAVVLTRGRDSLGSIAVLWFFLISGFLIAQSYIKSQNFRAYLSARILRIFPGLWVAIPFTIIVSSFASPVPWGKYLTHPATLRYWGHNSFLWRMEYQLPGAFLHTPLPRTVNGSLWTLPTEWQMYLICAGLGILGIYTLRPVFNAFLLTILMVAAATKIVALPFVDGTDQFQWEFAFLMGTAFYINREKIRLSLPLALVALLSTYPFRSPEMGRVFIVPAMAYFIFTVALHPAVFFRPFTRLGDYSYGLYIYAFPIQQQIVFYHPGIHWIPGLFMTYPVILGVAIVSWHLVEKPALSLKRYFNPRASSAPPADRELPREREVPAMAAAGVG
jgi:peptidoglycan/LPS O-acetylase OafA/YrhL